MHNYNFGIFLKFFLTLLKLSRQANNNDVFLWDSLVFLLLFFFFFSIKKMGLRWRDGESLLYINNGVRSILVNFSKLPVGHLALPEEGGGVRGLKRASGWQGVKYSVPRKLMNGRRVRSEIRKSNGKNQIRKESTFFNWISWQNETENWAKKRRRGQRGQENNWQSVTVRWRSRERGGYITSEREGSE